MNLSLALATSSDLHWNYGNQIRQKMASNCRSQGIGRWGDGEIRIFAQFFISYIRQQKLVVLQS
ncbi:MULTISPECIES: hypothetical protein [unclassified Okeania]|uniref:Uncharacterized protein n=1 Tax=Okeania hirsuta TaxID=1458930 RepID=A0A3N6NF15_9CYAN|nr:MULTISPECIES: hypothetical protein [unclassified Okeania]NET14199.1 hypothetical protein [Okeania sp. SIO1H6]RQH14324.1 hypothetical protein D4Z78_23050 [Okeania hirsuta]NES75756.1 hypothetical protein [Okeania sp. SIO1H4]NET19938.1 hypothetical protein [Okeania sp. SIO1H5]NET91772.1 hypothetical protein [Okeania sp. SIO1H2]